VLSAGDQSVRIAAICAVRESNSLCVSLSSPPAFRSRKVLIKGEIQMRGLLPTTKKKVPTKKRKKKSFFLFVI
jgi:hypothetical protein